MKKPNKFCFLVKKKRPRSCSPSKSPLNELKDPQKSREIFSVKTENASQMDNCRGKENMDVYKILECEDNTIILKKLHKENKKYKENKIKDIEKPKKIRKKINKSDVMVINSDVVIERLEGLLDFDKFLEEYNLEDIEHNKVKINNEEVSQIDKAANNKFAESVRKEMSPLKLKNRLKNKKFDYKADMPLKVFKKRNKSNHKEDIYNINNFIIHPNQIKISHKPPCLINIMTPKFKDSDSILNNKLDSFSVSSFSSYEDTSDEAYSKYHVQYERREREWREKFFGIGDHKKKPRETNRNLLHDTRTESSEGNFKIRIDLDAS